VASQGLLISKRLTYSANRIDQRQATQAIHLAVLSSIKSDETRMGEAWKLLCSRDQSSALYSHSDCWIVLAKTQLASRNSLKTWHQNSFLYFFALSNSALQRTQHLDMNTARTIYHRHLAIGQKNDVFINEMKFLANCSKAHLTRFSSTPTAESIENISPYATYSSWYDFQCFRSSRAKLKSSPSAF